MEMTRSTSGCSLSQRLELGCYEPSAHGRQAVTGSAGAGCRREPWNVMSGRSCVDISASIDGMLSMLRKLGSGACVAGDVRLQNVLP
jgi:hypothetical protein